MKTSTKKVALSFFLLKSIPRIETFSKAENVFLPDHRRRQGGREQGGRGQGTVLCLLFLQGDTRGPGTVLCLPPSGKKKMLTQLHHCIKILNTVNTNNHIRCTAQKGGAF